MRLASISTTLSSLGRPSIALRAVVAMDYVQATEEHHPFARHPAHAIVW